MTARSGQFTDLIQFQRKVRTYQGEIEYISWANDFNEWADGERLAEQISTFRIHYRKGITPDTHRILAFDAIWNITNVLPDARYSELKIECDWSAMIEVTHLKSPRREWITGVPAVATPIPPPEEDEEFMNPIITDISSEVTFPQTGAAMLDGVITVITTGKLQTVTIDAHFKVPIGAGFDPNNGFLIRLPAAFAARNGADFAGTFLFGGEEETTTVIPPAAGSMYVGSLDTPDADILSLFFWNDQIHVQGGQHIYVAGQMTYVSQ